MIARPPPIAGWAVGAVFFFYAWVLRVSPSVMVEELMAEFAVGAAILGHMSALYFYGYAGMQIPVGLLLDRFGPRRLMTVAACVCALGCLAFVSDSLALVSLGRFLIGAGAAFSLVGALAVAGQWFAPQRFALLSGLAMMMGMAGGVFGQAPLRLLVEASDWRTAIATVGGFALLIALAAWTCVRDVDTAGGDLRQLLAGLRSVLARPQNWLNALIGLGATAPLLGFAALWGVPFLQASHAVSRAEAAATASLMLVGWGIGSTFFGWWSGRLGRRRRPLAIGLGICLVSTLALVYLPSLPLAASAALCLLAGFGGSAQIVGFALVREGNPRRLSGTAIGFLNAMVTGAGALFQPLVGALLDAAWDGASEGGARIYSLDDYRVALGAIVVAVAIALGCSRLLRETHGRLID